MGNLIVEKKQGTAKARSGKYYLRPHAAEELMKNAQATKQTVYICGSSGFGKTSFIADFFSRERYEYYSAGEKSVARIARVGRGDGERIVVVDNLHLLLSPEERGNVLEILKSLAANKKVWLILSSRCPLPSWLIPVYIEQFFITIDERALAFSEQEEMEYLKSWGITMSERARESYRSFSEGQPLFLKIVAMRLSQIAREDLSEEEIEAQEQEALLEAQEDYYDYIDSHVYDCWDDSLQEFLTDISIMDSFTLKMAQFVTRKNDAGHLLLRSQELGTFLIEYNDGSQPVFRLRESVRQSLQRRLFRRYSKKHIEDLYYGAGRCYEVNGNLPCAMDMYEKSGNEEAVSRLLVGNSRVHPGVGFYWDFRRYYRKLPEDTIKRNMDLMTGMSILYSILMDDNQSERWYRELEKYMEVQSGNNKKLALSRLLYLDITLPQREVRGMLEKLKDTLTVVLDKKLVLPEFSLTNNQPSVLHGAKDFCEWTRYGREVLEDIDAVSGILLRDFGKGLVSLALAESIFEKGGSNYEISSLSQKGRLQAQCGGKLELVFVSMALIGWLSVFENRLPDAIASLESFQRTIKLDAPHLLPGTEALKIEYMLYGGRKGEILEWLKKAPDEDAEFCTLERERYAVKARAYLATGKTEKALHLLHLLKFYAEKRKRLYLTMETGVLIAIAQERLGMETWIKTLQEALTLAEQYHFVRVLTKEGAAVYDLLKNPSLFWNEEEFREQVLEECGRMARQYPAYLGTNQQKKRE